MSTRIYYYTGTGNSLWAARILGGTLPGSEPVCLASDSPAGLPAGACAGAASGCPPGLRS